MYIPMEYRLKKTNIRGMDMTLDRDVMPIKELA
jgi:hypothetical protein